MNESVIRQKIARLRAGKMPRVLDLFSGCGGLSLGFHAAGYEIAAAVEFDRDAAKSHGTNFHKGAAAHCLARDITTTPPATLTSALGLGKPESAFDIIVGGPPCQAFARVGRSKLREVADHPEAFRHDPRARLYIDYLDYVDICVPVAVVMENVPDMLNHGGHNIAEEVAEVLDSRGYACGYTLLNSAFYGVPQMRERMLLIAIHRELAGEVHLPEPTHWIDLPPGYEGSRAVALKLLANTDNSAGENHYLPAIDAHPKKGAKAVTAEEALKDLPVIDARAQMKDGTLKRGARRFDVPLAYGGADKQTGYAKLMREWHGFTGRDKLLDHVIRYLPRDYELFARLKAGDQYPEAFKCAGLMFEEALARLDKRPRKNSAAWKALRDSIVPPYDPGKFPNKWRKMEPDKPARTLLAHLGKDGYSHIHYDSAQARTISVREAARLQSFPDGFVFCGTMNPAFRQIGNAVPPLMAKAVAESVLEQIRAALCEPGRLAKVAGAR
ncbi:DNA-cytosine methyltransferase [Paramagnetospirillum caucaseum]|uniref:DNA (cytosine-5-)-methyltransferase n=1 Tax=Paramagnetospirillum caucaseum TaxID=1244869 RepID=M3A6Q3_9PROT|nr:DNA cytosine methyltransferase [Paramagnetospirillum caucaseum]EME68488.1 DNA-cytosine methyltransferase [Paramagnetospirillum caucaseum]